MLRRGWRGDDHAEPPDKLNALNGEMYAGILAALDQTDSDDSVRAVIVTGAGRAFCAGADLSGGSRDVRLRRGQLRSGGAPGPGRDADGAASWFLPRIVGISQALEWCLSGRVFGAAEALAGGLVRTVCAPGEVLPLATRLAREIAAHTAPASAPRASPRSWRSARRTGRSPRARTCRTGSRGDPSRHSPSSREITGGSAHVRVTDPVDPLTGRVSAREQAAAFGCLIERPDA